jgi:subtilisin-like proprotein convertase family protein
VVDTLPPTVTLTKPADEAGLLVGESVRLTGGLFDNHGLAGAEACLDEDCEPATVELVGTETTRIYADAPAAPLPIEGGACTAGSGIARTFSVTESFILGEVNVGFSARHPRRDELEVTLTAPSGEWVRLLTDDGLSGTAYSDYDVLLDDTAAGSYAPRHDDVATGTFARRGRPAAPLAAFVGLEAAGTWRLVICDSDPATDDGVYLGSRLHLSPTPARRTARTGAWSTVFRSETELDYVPLSLNVVGVDLAGNRTADPLRVDLVVDNVAPKITVTHVTTRATFAQCLDVLAGEVTDGSLTAGGDDGLRISVLIEGPSGTYNEAATRAGTRWHYRLRPSAPGTYRLSVSAYDRAGNVTTGEPFDVQVTPWQQLYFPLVGQNYVEAPDLVVQQIDAGPEGVQVVIANRGSAPTVDDFWVDLYVDPAERPWEVNETWALVGAQGAAWGVTTPIQPGEALTLTVGDVFYHEAHSQLNWPLQVGDLVYAQVDSAGDPAYGGVLEDHEILAWGYKNFAETTVSAVTTGLSHPELRIHGFWGTRMAGLPPRP